MSINSQNVLDYPNNNTILMVWNFKKEPAIKDAFKKLRALISNLNNSSNVRFPDSKASVVLGIGYGAWHLLDLPKPHPKEFEEFAPVAGAKHTAVATKGDLHLHIRADEHSFCFDAASAISQALAAIADSRSILGFVDGHRKSTWA